MAAAVHFGPHLTLVAAAYGAGIATPILLLAIWIYAATRKPNIGDDA